MARDQDLTFEQHSQHQRGYEDGMAGVPYSRHPQGWDMYAIHQWNDGWRQAYRERIAQA